MKQHLTSIKKLSIVNCPLSIVNFSIILLLFFASPLKSQVTIGSQDPPHSFSVLELTTKMKDGGLRMPQLKTTEREALDAELKGDDSAKGLIVYDTDLDCLEFWNGEGWISLCVDKLVDCSTVTYPELKESYDFLVGATIANLIDDIGGNVKLYDAPTDGNLYDDPSTLLVAGRTYYAEQRVSNCSRRVPVAVTISTAAVSGSATIDACITAMYDFQYQTLTAYNAANAAIWQWYAKRRGEADSEYKPIPNATAVSYKIPANFVKDVFRKTLLYSGTDNNDSVVFQVKVSNALKFVIPSDTLDIEFIDTYGNDYVALKAPPSITGYPNTGGVIKVAYLNLGVEPDADGYNACNFGSLYQWGRWRDGHEKITWAKAANRDIAFDAATQNNQKSALDLTDDDYDSNPRALEGAGNLPFYQVTNADYKDKFLFNNSTPPVWNTARSDERYFWAAQTTYAKTSNDPCPTGWHVPTRFEFGAIFQGTPSSDNPSTATNLNNTWTWRPNIDIRRIAGGMIVTYGDGSDKSKRIFMPAAGSHSSSIGTLSGAGSNGTYWSSTGFDNTSGSYALIFSIGIVNAAGNTNYALALGFSVRCIAE